MVDDESINGAGAGPAGGSAEAARDADSRQELDGKLIVALERAGHALRTELRLRAQAASMTLTQAEILLRLASGRLGRGRRRVGMLAREFDVRQPTVSDAVAALERKRMVERRPSPDDARSSELVLTEAGRAAAAGLGTWEHSARAILAERLEGEKEVVLGLLIDLIAGLHRAGAIEVARTCTTCRFFRPAAAGKDPRCALLDMTLGRGDLRVDCPEHEPVVAT